MELLGMEHVHCLEEAISYDFLIQASTLYLLGALSFFYHLMIL